MISIDMEKCTHNTLQFIQKYFKKSSFVCFIKRVVMVLQMAFSVVYVGISYYLTSQLLEKERFFMFILVNAITIVISECLGLGLGTAINPVVSITIKNNLRSL